MERLVRQANVPELAVHLEGGQVIRKRELIGGVRAVEDHVEGEGELLVPVLLGRVYKVLRTKLKGILLLAGRMRECVGLGSTTLRQSCFSEEVERGYAQCGRPLNTKVAKSSNSDDGDLLSRSDVVALER